MNESIVEDSNEGAATSDPAAVFACALSIWRACHELAEKEPLLNLSGCFNGVDEFMRVAMRVATRFEAWANGHVAFDEIDEVWPYLLQDRFGEASLAVFLPEGLVEFGDDDCLSVALHMRLPVSACDGIPVPIDVSAVNPVSNSPFVQLRIQTARIHHEERFDEAFVVGDEPFDEEYGPPHFALYGVATDGTVEHIADRVSYAEIVRLARNLAPGIEFPDRVHS